MASFNKIVIVGYLGRDPEIRYTPQGDAFCSFTVATTEKRKDNTGEMQDSTTWFRVTTWRRQAEIANQYLSKGKQVYIEGRLRQNEYTDRDGNRRTSLEVTATDMHFLGAKGDDAGAPPSSSSKPSTRPASSSDGPDEGPPPLDDEIPF